ncbi:hypothetical protein DFH06DRAFT_1135618 [Mycena polygramma]|nr:hypothetical protein DFH06DRAFT_1135618 [Mycena polygramma]
MFNDNEESNGHQWYRREGLEEAVVRHVACPRTTMPSFTPQMAPIWCRPDVQFFDSEQAHDATRLIGTYDLRSQDTTKQYGHGVYTTGQDGRTMRAFICGVISASLAEVVIALTLMEPDITRYELRVLPDATDCAALAFKNDVSALVAAMIEDISNTVNGDPGVGQCVVVDVSLHRIDAVVHGMKCKVRRHA